MERLRAGQHKGFKRFGKSRFLLTLLLIAVAVSTVIAAEVIPPPPKAYFNDHAGVTRPEVARQLNRELEQFERDTSNQIVVAIYPKMQTDSSIEDYTVRIAQSWHVGQKGRNNGAVLFVFIQDRKMFIQVGYGLEPTLTDYLCSQIINNELKPRFRAGDFNGGLTAAVHAMMAATKGEYKGSGQTVAESQRRVSRQQNVSGPSFIVMVFLFIVLMILFRIFTKFMGGGGGGSGFGGPFIFTGGGGSDFGGGSGGGGFGGGDSGGGFSGGGGSFGGGGAGGDW